MAWSWFLDRAAHLAADPNPQEILQWLEVGDECVSASNWPVQMIFARFVFLTHKRWFFLLYIIHILLTIEAKWPSGQCVYFQGVDGWRSGVRSLPPALCVFSCFFLTIRCKSRLAAQHVPLRIKVPDGPRPYLVIQEWGSIIDPVNARPPDPGRSTRPAC